MNKSINKKVFFGCFFLFIVSIVSKIIQYVFLSEKNFLDSAYILSLMKKNIEKSGAYYLSAEFYKKINIFNFSTLLEWSVFLSLIATIFLIFLIIKRKSIKNIELLFIYINLIMLNFYVFNLSKDFIQFLIFLIIFAIVKLSITNNKKVFIITSLFILEGLTFRQYYLLIAYAFIIVYWLLKLFINEKKSKKINFVRLIICAFILFLIPIYLLQNFFPLEFNRIINVRDALTNSLNANTEIVNLIKGNNFLVFSINYFINGLRIFFPLELFVKGVKYIPFIIFQLWLTSIIVKNVQKISKENILFLSIVLAYFIGSISYEPDFGSVIRHESTLFLFYYSLNTYYYSKKGDTNEKIYDY